MSYFFHQNHFFFNSDILSCIGKLKKSATWFKPFTMCFFYKFSKFKLGGLFNIKYFEATIPDRYQLFCTIAWRWIELDDLWKHYVNYQKSYKLYYYDVPHTVCLFLLLGVCDQLLCFEQKLYTPIYLALE